MGHFSHQHGNNKRVGNKSAGNGLELLVLIPSPRTIVGVDSAGLKPSRQSRNTKSAQSLYPAQVSVPYAWVYGWLLLIPILAVGLFWAALLPR